MLFCCLPVCQHLLQFPAEKSLTFSLKQIQIYVMKDSIDKIWIILEREVIIDEELEIPDESGDDEETEETDVSMNCCN